MPDQIATAPASPSREGDAGEAKVPAQYTVESPSPAVHGGGTSRLSGQLASAWTYICDRCSYVPPRCRYDPERPFHFGLGLNLLFAYAGCFTVANLYYSHPILNLLARDFHVTDEQASYIPTMAQAGYATGLVFLCPLGDLVKRRPFILWLVWFTATIWIGLCLTRSFGLFLAISYLTGATTVTPQLMLPLVGELAPPERRGTALSIVVSGLMFGLLTARVLSGVITQFIGWRYIYWISCGLQYSILILLFFFMPDYPSSNPNSKSVLRRYPGLLLDILKMIVKFPVLVQACLIGYLCALTFTAFWTTLTFLLAGEPYNYSSSVIGLFGLIAISAMCVIPLFARLVMDKHIPLFSVILGEILALVGVCIGTFAGLHTVAAPVIQAISQDIGLQIAQTGNRLSIYAVAPKGQNRVNTAFMASVFTGQLTGTAVGNHLYAQGGWIRSGSGSVGFMCLSILVSFVRGPNETGWVGWGGGWNVKRTNIPKTAGLPDGATDEEKGSHEGDVGKQQPMPSGTNGRHGASDVQSADSSSKTASVNDLQNPVKGSGGIDEKEVT